jgi:single-stranded-DNA-specific exonuclease
VAESAFSFAPKSFLGVSRSALGRTWIERCEPARAPIAMAIAQTHGLPEVLARVLAGRGVGVQETPTFLAPRLRDLLPDPYGLRDMEFAAGRLADAVERRETVAIFGDYDVDGACSAALLAEYLRACDVPYLIHIPDRITEGYGPNVEAVRRLKEQGAGLLVTVDCGTASHEPLGEARHLGLDPLVLDHHQAPEKLPPAVALVNPNRQDDISGLGHLCAAGVVFLTLVALNRALRLRGFWKDRKEPDLLASLDLVALATVADVVPLTGLNRAFVRQGLTVMRGRTRVGLAALMDAGGLSGAPEAWHLGYLVGPRINAGGRIGDAALGSKLLLTQDAFEAGRLATELDRLNRERQVIEQEAVEEAEAQALRALGDVADAPVVVTLGIDGTLMATAAQPTLVAAIERAGPFGAGQPEPMFAFPNHRLVEAKEVGSSGHVRIRLRGPDGSTIGGIAFRAAGQPLGLALSKAIGTPIHAAGSLCIDRWGGGEKVDLRLCDIATPSVC